jgi:hypothetical protein
MGEYDNSTCLLYSSDADSTFLIYYPRMFESGVVCSASEVVVYNSSNVAIPASTSHKTAVLTCQSSEIFGYCAYDCSANDGIGGIMCSCMVDEVSLDPYLLGDPVSDCQNSALLNIPQTRLTLAATKQREPHSLQITFASAGDKSLKWNVTTTRANSTAATTSWRVAPRAGRLTGCAFGIITVELPT